MGGRWNMLRVAEFLTAKPVWQQWTTLPAFVYGSTSADIPRQHPQAYPVAAPLHARQGHPHHHRLRPAWQDRAGQALRQARWRRTK